MKILRKEYKVIGMDCPSCAMVIEGELEDAGVNKAQCSYVDEKLVVEFEDDKVEEKKIKEVVKEAGYEMIESEHINSHS